VRVISAIVLAAGEASRFGRCKQLLVLDGKTLIEHVLDRVRQSRVDEVLVVLGAHAEAIRAKIPDACIVINDDYANGMSTSIQAGLRATNADAAMIVLADQPFIAPSSLDALINAYEQQRARIVIPTFEGARGNPVIIDRTLFAEVMELRGDVGCRAIFGRHAEGIVTVAVDDRGVVTDIDTIEDLDRVTLEHGA
jgi:molybdenum cofactor cytidylyltransferase